ncbi:hypothetical protein D3C87_277540 [compost metagenome]
MNCIELTEDQISRDGKYPAPNVSGYNSLFFHPLTGHGSKKDLEQWGYQLTVICEEQGIEYYCFYNDFRTKINVYPNSLIEQWWISR